MKRTYQRGLPKAGAKRTGFSVTFMLFIAFVAYTILTPPSREMAVAASPDGRMTARLRKIYYTKQPSYKIDCRETGKLLWLNLFHLSSYTNTPDRSAVETLSWSTDSKHLYFTIGEDPVWEHDFRDGN